MLSLTPHACTAASRRQPRCSAALLLAPPPGLHLVAALRAAASHHSATTPLCALLWKVLKVANLARNVIPARARAQQGSLHNGG